MHLSFYVGNLHYLSLRQFLCLRREASEDIMFLGCSSIHPSVRTPPALTPRRHGLTDLIHNLYKRSTLPAKVFYQRSRS